jgi:hypothetical protein
VDGHWWDIGRTPTAIYGTIISASVLALADEEDDLLDTALALVITLVIYWLAERWSVLMARNLKGERITWSAVRGVFVSGWPMVQASYGPALVLVIAGLLGLGTLEAVDLALTATILMLAGLGALGAQRAGLGRLGIVGSSVFVALLGIVLILLKALLH